MVIENFLEKGVLLLKVKEYLEKVIDLDFKYVDVWEFIVFFYFFVFGIVGGSKKKVF